MFLCWESGLQTWREWAIVFTRGIWKGHDLVQEVRFRNKETITGSKTVEEVNMQRQNNEAKTPWVKDTWGSWKIREPERDMEREVLRFLKPTLGPSSPKILDLLGILDIRKSSRTSFSGMSLRVPALFVFNTYLFNVYYGQACFSALMAYWLKKLLEKTRCSHWESILAGRDRQRAEA